jgi:hypothetical protein
VREADEHYVEPAWCSERLFRVERFEDCVHDPCAAFGTISEAARQAGLRATAADIIDRGCAGVTVIDFFDTEKTVANFVCNPPFNIARKFTLHALKLVKRKVAIIFPTAASTRRGGSLPRRCAVSGS